MELELKNGIAEIMLNNIIRVMSTKTFGKVVSASIVGGEKKLERLIEKGEIQSEKESNSQNGKWQCNAAQVLLHCRCTSKRKPKKTRK